MSSYSIPPLPRLSRFFPPFPAFSHLILFTQVHHHSNTDLALSNLSADSVSRLTACAAKNSPIKNRESKMILVRPGTAWYGSWYWYDLKITQCLYGLYRG